MQWSVKRAAAIAVIVCGALGMAEFAADAAAARPSSGAHRSALLRVGHDNVTIDPSLRRFTGVVTALGAPDAEGRIYSFRASPVGPDSVPPAADEMQKWRLTILAGKRFAAVFEVQSNTQSEISVSRGAGPLNGLAVTDVFIIEEIGAANAAPDDPAAANGST